MQKKYFLFLMLYFFTSVVFAQDQSLYDFNEKRLTINKAGMMVLGSWAIGNIVVNSVLTQSAHGARKYFYNGNIYWNIANLTLAGIGLYSSLTADPGAFTLSESIKQHFSIQKLLLLNTGLDIAYITSGFFLRERSKNIEKRKDMFRGFGNALLLQGSFLFVFDLTLYFIHSAHSDLINNLIIDDRGIGLILRF